MIRLLPVLRSGFLFSVVASLSVACGGGDGLYGVPTPPEPPAQPVVVQPPVAIAVRSGSQALAPLDTVTLDGRQSYDPRDANNDALLVDYRWEVITYPAGANPQDFAPTGQGSSTFGFWLPLAGHYVVRLTVTNDAGIASADTAQARVEFDVVPPEDLHIQLVWDQDNDLDLHLVYSDESTTVCDPTWDCHWQNQSPEWFATDDAGVGPNPRLDIDDVDGIGPENINIDSPTGGRYRIYVHYYDSGVGADTPDTRATVRVFINGTQTGEYVRTLEVNDVWALSDVVWTNSVGGTLQSYASDASGQVGTLENMGDSLECELGWEFP